MSLVLSDAGFEVLKGTLLTDNGWEGVRAFKHAEQRPSHLVVDEAFTPYCEELLIDQRQGMVTYERPMSIKLSPLIDFLADTCLTGIGQPNGVSRTWIEMKELELHIDFELGHTAVGNFGIEGQPHIDVYDKIVEEPVFWEDTGLSPGVGYLIPVSKDKKVSIPFKDRQLILINGDAVKAVEYHATLQTVKFGRASVPHEVFFDEKLDSRKRLMVQGHKQLP